MELGTGTKGMIIGLLNTVATALGAAVYVTLERPRLSHVDDPEVGVWSHAPTISALGTAVEVAVLVLMIGAIPGTLVGGVLGLVAREGARAPRWVRVAVLALLAEAAVFALGVVTGFVAFIPVAAVSALLASLALERWARRG